MAPDLHTSCPTCRRSELLTWQQVEQFCLLEREIARAELLEELERNGQLLATNRYMAIYRALGGAAGG